MRASLGVLLLVWCGAMTVHRAQAWHSEIALWQAATVNAPQLPRPAVNLAAAFLRARNWPAATTWSLRAAALAHVPERRWMQDTIRPHVWIQLLWIDAVWPICDRPQVRPWCVSSWQESPS